MLKHYSVHFCISVCVDLNWGLKAENRDFNETVFEKRYLWAKQMSHHLYLSDIFTTMTIFQTLHLRYFPLGEWAWVNISLSVPLNLNTAQNSQIFSKKADPLTQTYPGQRMHVDETAALFSDLLLYVLLLFLEQPQGAALVLPAQTKFINPVIIKT